MEDSGDYFGRVSDILESAASKFGSSEAVSNFFKIVGNEIGSVGPDISGAIKKIKEPSIWTEKKCRNTVENAFKHWKDHKSDLPRLNNALEYVEEANSFVKHPPQCTICYKVAEYADYFILTFILGGEIGDCPSFDICICCGTEFGYHDATPEGARKKRAAWIAAGAKWDMVEHKPQGWKLEDQLTNIPDDFR